jgi:hypothetical protein
MMSSVFVASGLSSVSLTGGKLSAFFIHLLTVVRSTPNILFVSRKLMRSSYALMVLYFYFSEYPREAGFSLVCLLQSLQRYFCFPFGE